MNLPLKIANRLRLSQGEKGGERAPGVTIAVMGVAVALVVMILTLAVVSGFQSKIRSKVIGFDSQISVSLYSQQAYKTEYLDYDDTIRNVILRSLPPGATLSPSISTTALLKTDDDYVGLQFVSDGNVLDGYIRDYIIIGSDTLLPDVNSLVVSSITARRLNLDVGNRIYAYFFSNGDVKTRRLTVSAIYDTSFGERDCRIAFCSAELLRSVCGIDSTKVGKINISGLEFDNLDGCSDHLQQELVSAFYSGELKDVYEVNCVLRTAGAYFGWLELLDTNVIVIIILMSVVAAFTLVSSLFILVLERVKMIGVLKALGATDGLISRIFIYLAMRIVAYGMIIGNVIGLLLVAVQWKFHTVPLDPDSYYLTYVPVSFNVSDWLLLNIGAVMVSWLVLVLPAMIVSRISPATTIRYE